MHRPDVNGEQLILFVNRSLLGSKYYSPQYGLLYLKHEKKVIYELCQHIYVMCATRLSANITVSFFLICPCVL
jgi:hypothetical protein